jgi:hypothetical protein
MNRRCNLTLIDDTSRIFHSVRRSLPRPTVTAVQRHIVASNTAARNGRCAEMHKYAQAARVLLERKLDALLGSRRR